MQTNVAPQDIPDKNKNNGYTKDISKWSKDRVVIVRDSIIFGIREDLMTTNTKWKVQFLRGGAIADITSTIYPILMRESDFFILLFMWEPMLLVWHHDTSKVIESTKVIHYGKRQKLQSDFSQPTLCSDNGKAAMAIL